MPTIKKRVNLALSDQVYERLLKYKEKNGISSDAGACVMLITRQLEAIENTEKMLEAASKFSLEELQQIANVGVPAVKQLIDMQKQGNGN
jgi:predicted CopG family antitoxin